MNVEQQQRRAPAPAATEDRGASRAPSSRRRLIGLPLVLLLTAATAVNVSAQTARVRVDLDGLEGELRANAQVVAGIFAAQRRGPLPTARIQQLYDRGVEEVELALQPFGYYRPTVQSQLTSEGSTWVARYQVDPGPPLIVSSVDIRMSGDGENDAAIQAAVHDFPIAAGDTLRHDRYEQGKSSLARPLAERGYLDASLDTAEIRVNLNRYTAEILLCAATGPRYLFGSVTFNQDAVDPTLLRGFVTFEPGDTFELPKLLELQRGLSSSPFFNQVEVVPQPDAAEDRQVPIEVNAVARKRQRYELGVGYGTDTGFRGSVEADFRRLNRKGHNATIRVEYSQIRRSIVGQYRFPPKYPKTANYAINIGLGDYSPTWSKTLRAGLGVSRSELRGPLREVLSISYEADDFEIAEQSGTSLLLMVGASYSWTKADDRLVPRASTSRRSCTSRTVWVSTSP